MLNNRRVTLRRCFYRALLFHRQSMMRGNAEASYLMTMHYLHNAASTSAIFALAFIIALCPRNGTSNT